MSKKKRWFMFCPKVTIFASMSLRVNLKNNTKATSLVGRLAKVDPQKTDSFIYLSSNELSFLGVVAQAKPYRDDTEIITNGECLVYVNDNAVKGSIIRALKSTESYSQGSCRVARGSDAPYLKVGIALESGRGLIRVSLSQSYIQATGGGGGSVTSAAYVSLVNRVSANSAVGGGGSVTSNELSVVKDLVSNEISNRVSASAVLDAKISNLSAIVVTGLASAEAHASAVSAAVTSVDGRATSLEARLSTLSALVTSGIASVDGRATSLADNISTISVRVDTLSNAISNEISNRVSASAILDAKISSLSAIVVTGISSVDGRVTSVESYLSDKISLLSTNLSPQYFYPTKISVNVGTLVSGTTADLSSYGGNSFLVSEILSTPGFAVTMQFSAVSAVPNNLNVYGRYEGNAGHSVHVDLFNHVTSAWDTIGEIAEDVSAHTHIYNIHGGTAYLSGTNSRLRFYHVQNGVVTHSFYLDYIALGRISEGIGITDHGALNGLDDDDHIQYALADGTRGFSTVSNAISNEISVRTATSAALEAHASAASAAATSVDGRATSLESRLSTLSALVISGLASAEVLRSTLSAAHVSTEGRVTSLESRISTVSGLVVAAETHASTASAAATSVDTRINSVNSTIGSAVTNVSAVSAAGSATGLQNVVQCLSARITSVAALVGGASVTSTELSTVKSAIENASTVVSLAALSLFASVSATLDAKISSLSTIVANASARNGAGTSVKGLQSAINQHSNWISAISNTLSALEVRVSGISATVATSAGVNTRINNLSTGFTYGGQVSMDRFSMAFMSVPATISASALTGVSGTTIQVSSGSFYILQGMFAITSPAGMTQLRLGITIPACNMLKGQMNCTASVGQGAITASLKNYNQPILAGAAGGSSTILSVVSTTGTEKFVMIDAILNPSATGNIIFMVGAAAGASAAIVSAGGFLRTEKLR